MCDSELRRTTVVSTGSQETMSCRLKQMLWNMDNSQSSTIRSGSMMAMVPNKDPLIRSTKESTTGSTKGSKASVLCATKMGIALRIVTFARTKGVQAKN